MKKTILALSIFGLLFVSGLQSVQAKETDRPALLAQLESLLKLVQQLQQQVSLLQTSQGQAVSTNSIFSEPVVMGAENDSVRLLQQILASDPAVYPEGKVTGYFGSLTESALMKFQQTWKLETTGTLNEQTSFVLAATLNQITLDSSNQNNYLQKTEVKSALTKAINDYAVKSLVINGKVVFSSDPVFELGKTNSDVATLQKILATDSKIYPENKVTGLFDIKTAAAVSRYQTKYGLPVTAEVDTKTLESFKKVLITNNSAVIKSDLLTSVKGVTTKYVDATEEIEYPKSVLIRVDSSDKISVIATYKNWPEVEIGSSLDFSGNETVEYAYEDIRVSQLAQIIISDARSGSSVSDDMIKLMRQLVADYYGVKEYKLPDTPVYYDVI